MSLYDLVAGLGGQAPPPPRQLANHSSALYNLVAGADFPAFQPSYYAALNATSAADRGGFGQQTLGVAPPSKGGGNLLSNIFGLIPSPVRRVIGDITSPIDAAGTSVVDQLLKAERTGVRALAGKPNDPNTNPSLYDLVANIADANKRLSGQDVLKNEGVQFAPHAFTGSGVLNNLMGQVVGLGSSPLTYIAPGFSKGADAAAAEIATQAGKEAVALGGQEAAAHSPEIASKLADISSQATDAINAVRKGGPSALTAEQSAQFGIRRGVGLRLPGDHYIPLTPGTGPLAEVSQARHAVQQGLLEHVLGGAGDMAQGAPTKLGEIFGKSDPQGAALARSANAPNAFGNTVARLVSRTEGAQTGQFTTQLQKEFYKALKGTPEAEVKAAFKEGGAQGLVDHLVTSSGGATQHATSQLFDGTDRAAALREAIGNRLEQMGAPKDARAALADYAKVGGQELANQAKAESLVSNYGLAGHTLTPAGPSDLQAAIQENQNALQGALAKQQEVQGALAPEGGPSPAPPVDPIAAHEAASTARATQSPKLIAEAEQHSGGAPQAASFSPNAPQTPAAAPGSPSASAPVPPMPSAPAGAPAATQEGSQALGLQGLDTAPSEGTFVPPPSKATQALEAAQAAPGNAEVQAKAEDLRQKIASAKDLLESNPKSGPARYSTPYKVKMWAHANALGINTDQSATRIEAALKKVVREQEAAPALAEAHTAAEATKAAVQSSPQESAGALQAHADAMAKEIPNATPAHAVAAQANTQIDQAGLRVKDPTYAYQQSQKFQQQISSEIASGRATPDAAEVLAQHKAWADVAAQAAKDGNPKLAETAQLNQTALEVGHRIDLLRESAKRLAAIDPTKADQIAQIIMKSANEYSGFRSIVNGIEAPHDVADMLGRAHDVAMSASKPGGLLKTYDSLLRGYKAGKLATPGFQVRLLFGHTFANLMARVQFEAYAGWARAELDGGAHLEPGVWEKMNSGIGMGQAAHEGSYLRGSLNEPARLIEGHTMPWENKAVQAVNPFSTRGPLARATQTGAEAIQRQFRGALMYDRMVLRGQSFDQAIQDMYRFHFNYSDMSKGDQAMRRLVPFYTFMRNNVPLQVQMLVEHPQVALRVAQAQQALSKSSNPLMPGALLDMAASPLTAAVNQVTDPKGTAAGMLSPILTGPAEWAQMHAVAKSNASNPDSATNVWGQGFVSGKPLLLDDLPIPKIIKDVAVSAGLANRLGGKTYMTADKAFALQKAIPALSNFVRNTSDQPNIAKNRLANQLRFWIGANIPPPAQDQSQFAKLDAKNAAQAQRQISHDVLGTPLYLPKNKPYLYKGGNRVRSYSGKGRG